MFYHLARSPKKCILKGSLNENIEADAGNLFQIF